MKYIDILNLALKAAMDEWARWDAFMDAHPDPDNAFACADRDKADAQVSEIFGLSELRRGGRKPPQDKRGF